LAGEVVSLREERDQASFRELVANDAIGHIKAALATLEPVKPAEPTTLGEPQAGTSMDPQSLAAGQPTQAVSGPIEGESAPLPTTYPDVGGTWQKPSSEPSTVPPDPAAFTYLDPQSPPLSQPVASEPVSSSPSVEPLVSVREDREPVDPIVEPQTGSPLPTVQSQSVGSQDSAPIGSVPSSSDTNSDTNHEQASPPPFVGEPPGSAPSATAGIEQGQPKPYAGLSYSALDYPTINRDEWFAGGGSLEGWYS
jgi:hypothetical protein